MIIIRQTEAYNTENFSYEREKERDMLTLPVILFAIAALGGLTLATLHITKSRAPIPLALLHGAIAATALILLLIGVLKANLSGLPVLAIIIFAAAAVGGLVLFITHLRSRPLPRPLIFIHGGAAVTAFIILLVFVLS